MHSPEYLRRFPRSQQEIDQQLLEEAHRELAKQLAKEQILREEWQEQEERNKERDARNEKENKELYDNSMRVLNQQHEDRERYARFTKTLDEIDRKRQQHVATHLHQGNALFTTTILQFGATNLKASMELTESAYHLIDRAQAWDEEALRFNPSVVTKDEKWRGEHKEAAFLWKPIHE